VDDTLGDKSSPSKYYLSSVFCLEGSEFSLWFVSSSLCARWKKLLPLWSRLIPELDFIIVLLHIHNNTSKTTDRVIQTVLKTGGELRCSGRVSSSCSTSGTRSVNLVTNPVVSHEWGMTGKCLREVEHILGHLWHRYSIILMSVLRITDSDYAIGTFTIFLNL
jgi:hypothetical protein